MFMKDGWTSCWRSTPPFVVTSLERLCYVSARPVEAVQNLSVFGSDLLLLVITASAPEAETCVFKPWVASSFLEGLGVTRIALFSSQARM